MSEEATPNINDYLKVGRLLDRMKKMADMLCPSSTRPKGQRLLSLPAGRQELT